MRYKLRIKRSCWLLGGVRIHKYDEGHRGHGAGNTMERDRARQHYNIDDAHPERSILKKYLGFILSQWTRNAHPTHSGYQCRSSLPSVKIYILLWIGRPFYIVCICISIYTALLVIQ